MADGTNTSGPDPDEERLARIATELADRIEAVVAPWIEGLVTDRFRAWQGHVPEAVAADATRAGADARDELMPVLRELLGADIDEQAANPLELLRVITGHADEVLARHGVPAVERHPGDVRARPEDRYDLAPATWSDIDPDLHTMGITWGAAKAFVHRSRHER